MGVQVKMRDHVEKYVVLPFSMGCVSQASIDVAEQKPRKSKSYLQSPSSRNREEDEDDESLSGESAKHSSRFLALPRSNLSTGVNKLVKGFKSLSQLFIYEDEMEELGMEMEIGCPTDVKHVTHIGWDTLTKTNPFVEPDVDMDMDMDINPRPTSSTTTSSLKLFDEIATDPEKDSPTLGIVNTSSTG